MNADENAKPYIFISYSHRDRERVFPALDAMRERGYRFWYDADIQAGRQWTDELAASIAKCAVFVPFASDSYGASEFFCGASKFLNGATNLMNSRENCTE